MNLQQQFPAQQDDKKQRALLELHDDRSKLKGNPKCNAPQQNGTTSSVQLQNVSAESKARMQKQHSENKILPSPSRYFYVQFNPAELEIEASAPQEQQKNAEDGCVKTQPKKKPQMFLTVTLYFDDAQPYDAFLTEKLTPGVNGSMIATVKNAVQTIRKENVHTVQPEVEAFIAALRNPGTRNITFRWADFSFRGILQDVNATYTMFSVSGRPVRAKVFLRLRHDTEEDSIKPWTNAYSEVFGASENNLTKASQKLSGLLNFNL